VKSEDNIKKDLEKRKKEYVLDFIRKKDLISSDGNVIFSQKIFVVNSVLKWCLGEAESNKMSQTKWGKFNKIINQYIAGVVDLKWKDGSLEVIEIQNDDKKRRNPRRR